MSGIGRGGTVIGGRIMRASVSTVYNPLTAIPWQAAYWADDPSWVNPGDGQPVTSWRDGSGGGRTASGPVGKQPIFRASTPNMNGRSTVDFDGVSQYLTTASLTVPTPVTYFVVHCGNLGNKSIIWAGPSNAELYASIALRYEMGGAVTTVAPLTNAPQFVLAYWNSTASYVRTHSVNNTAVSGVTSTGVAGALGLAAHSDGTFPQSIRSAFWGIYAGDLQLHPGWNALKAWLLAYYNISTV